jgi:thiosulfate/3-mercaptopyruvate sulfurtransferase
MRRLTFAALLLGSVCLHSDAISAVARAAEQSPREAMLVSTAWLADHLNDRDLVLLHLGPRPDYDAGHIPGARFITLNDIATTDSTSPTGLTLQMPAPNDLRARLEKIGISNSSRIVVSFARDRIAMATRVIFALDYAGLGARASLLDGGADAWTREGRKTSTDVPAVQSGTLEPLKIRDAIVDADFVHAHRERAGFAIVDGRLPAFYDGTQTGGSAQRPHRTGHITGAKNIPYVETLDENQKLKSPEALRALFAGAGVKSGDTVIAYCHIGQQATAVVFAARSLGFTALLYDGSFEDWSRRTDLPVSRK